MLRHQRYNDLWAVQKMPPNSGKNGKWGHISVSVVSDGGGARFKLVEWRINDVDVVEVAVRTQQCLKAHEMASPYRRSIWLTDFKAGCTQGNCSASVCSPHDRMMCMCF